MNAIRTIIVDDEPLALKLLRTYLDKHAQIEIVGEGQNGRQAIEMANELQPELMFLDIQMPGLSGFDVIQNLQADTIPLVVFITAYDEYALKAFDVHAVDYLLKPLDSSSLGRAVARCKQRLLLKNNTSSNKTEIIGAIRDIARENISSSFNTNEPRANFNKSDPRGKNNLLKIVVKDRDAINLIDQHDIDWIDAAGDYMCIHVSGETYIMRSTLKALLAQLNPQLFKRVHRSTIVNITRVQTITPCAKSEYFLELGNNEKIKVSRNYKAAIKDLIAMHQGLQ
ncbi:MAG: two-component system LytT family response regulator [Cryomorphaceae bacterium]|jgi:two-component system LytT family response regulator